MHLYHCKQGINKQSLKLSAKFETFIVKRVCIKIKKYLTIFLILRSLSSSNLSNKRTDFFNKIQSLLIIGKSRRIV